MAIWHLATATIPELRRVAGDHGWVFFDRKDWCAVHAEQLGVTTIGVTA